MPEVKFSVDQSKSMTDQAVPGHNRWHPDIPAAATVRPGDEFRMEIELPNKNYLPLSCKALYRFDHTGIGVKFTDICEFEQELISKVISHKLELEGVPLQIDPFTLPPTFVGDDPSPRITDIREKRDAVLAKIMAADDSA